MKLSRDLKLGLAGVGLVLLLCLGLLIFATSGPTKTGPSRAVDPTVCEYCGKKLPKSGDCLSCIAEMGLDKYHAKRESHYWFNSPIIAEVVIGLVCILLVVYITLLWRRRAAQPLEEVYYTIHCRKCGRKLRYRNSQVNHFGKCPICQKPILFPKPPEEPKTSPWTKFRELVWG
jgi:phage FluMu protein Com